MPITRRQFELGIGNETAERMHQIAAYLETHSDEAFALNEIAVTIGLSDRKVEDTIDDLALLQSRLAKAPPSDLDTKIWKTFADAVAKLVYYNVIEARVFNGVTYYAKGRQKLPDLLDF